MSVTVTQQLTQQTVSVTGNPVENNVVVTVSNARGPAGTGGGSNAITSATTSDGTADLLLLNLETTTAEVTGTLTAPHIHGNLAGSLYAHVRAGEALTKGRPVYVSGYHSGTDTAIVMHADASNAAKMPAVGIMDADVANQANGHMVISGTISGLATNAYSINAELYVDAGGGLTATPPTARAQPVARVERSNANNGAILVKVNGLSASDATINTLVRRDASGGANFGAVEVTTLTASGIATSGQVEFNGTDAGDSLTFNMVNYTYGTGAAAAHRTALGATATGSALFTAATQAAAREALGWYQIASTSTTAAASGAGRVATPLVLTLPAGFYRLEMSTYFTNGGTGASGLYELELSAANAGWAVNERHGNVLAANVAGRLIPSSTTVGAFGLTQNQAATDSVGAWWNLNLSSQTTITVTIRNTAASGTSTHLWGSLIAQKMI